jgi:hypothetical protein
MMNAAECLAKADELDALAGQCCNENDRAGFVRTARGWRASAIVARQQDEWAAINGAAG